MIYIVLGVIIIEISHFVHIETVSDETANSHVVCPYRCENHTEAIRYRLSESVSLKFPYQTIPRSS